MGIKKYVKHIQGKLDNYFPKSVKRVEIPKENGETRPLGIPCIDDRIIQQSIKQILEPICEAKFHNHSYGFRPNRSTSHAVSRSMFLMNKNKLHYVVDIDIKGFFDNINHSKLKKQMWSLGVQDKNLISIIGKILKSEIEGIGVPNKGTPQGGIISPLLSNIVLNELDWWISNQWETFKTERTYNNTSNKYRAIKKTKLKEIFLVRYADDFKIFCRDYNTAKKIYHATTRWLKERLGLEISKEKSKITNLRKNYTEFLGFKLKVKPKNNKYVFQSKMSNKSVLVTIKKFKKQVVKIKNNPKISEVNKLNSMILGSHNYYKIATNVSKDFNKINFIVTKIIYNRLKSFTTDKPKYTKTYHRLYEKYNGKIRTIKGITLFPIYGVTTRPPLSFTQEICNYTEEGRKLIHDKVMVNLNKLTGYLLSQENNHSVEYNDNRISLICGQKGKCLVTNQPLDIGDMECHHKIPKSKGGTDEYKNLIWISKDVHKLIHAVKTDTINKYLGMLKLDKTELEKVNKLRKLIGNSVI